MIFAKRKDPIGPSLSGYGIGNNKFSNKPIDDHYKDLKTKKNVKNLNFIKQKK